MLKQLCVLSGLFLFCANALADQNVVIVLDDSGSMDERLRSDHRTKKIDAAKAALKTVLEQLPADSQVGVLVLNGGTDPWLTPLAPIDKAKVNSLVARIRARGGTPLGKSMKIAADALLEARSKQHYGTYKLLIVTDGEAGDKELVERYLPDIVSRGLVIDVIGVDMQQNHSLATKVQSYRNAADARSLEQAISDVVLGESTADANDAGESDFEMLEGLPVEVATEMLVLLADPGNQPIGQQRGSTDQIAVPTAPQGNASATNSTSRQATRSPTRNSTTVTRRSSGVNILASIAGFLCFGFVAVIMIIGIGVTMVIRTGSRR